MNTQLTAKQLEILDLCQNHPELEECFLELGEIAKDNIETLKTGDEAEEATVKAIQKTGQQVLQSWIEGKSKQLENRFTEDSEHRPHEKKN